MTVEAIANEAGLERLYVSAAAEVAAMADQALTITTEAPHGRMTWRVWGNGTPLLLLHGGGGSWSHWIRNIPVLSQHFRVIAPDLPGFGDSQMAILPADPIEIVEIMAYALRGLLNGEKADVAAFSFGGVVSGHLAALCPDIVSSLTLVGPVGLGISRNRPPKMERVAPTLSVAERWPLLKKNLKTLMIADDARIDALAIYLQDINIARTKLRSRQMSISETLGGRLRELRCPIRAVWGRQDSVYGVDLSERQAFLESLTPRGAATFIDPGGHWIQFERADAFNAFLLNALNPNSATPDKRIGA